jgi:hypothetical protein
MILAQTLPSPPESERSAFVSVIEGTIVDGSTGWLLPDVTVVLEVIEREYRTKTDKDGRYSFSGPFSGSCRLEAVAENGYLSSVRRLELAPERKPTTVNFKLSKGGVIAGRVTDVARQPVIGAAVHVRMDGYMAGRPALLRSRTRYTNEQGEFRITDLTPGRYVVQVTPRPAEFYQSKPAEASPREDPEPVPSNAITFYSGSPARDGASIISLAEGQSNEQVDIVMLRANGVCLSTTLVVPATEAIKDWISVALAEAYPMSQSKVAFGRFRSGGTVEVCGITPGLYHLTVTMQDLSERSLFSVQQVSVSGARAVRLPDTHLNPLQPVAGRVVHAGESGANQSKRDLPAILISLEPRYRIRWAAESLRAKSSSEGHFLIPATMFDEYWVRIFDLPIGFYVKSVEYAGREAYVAPFRPGVGDLTIVLSDDGPVLAGTVTDKENRPIAKAIVLLMPASLPINIAPNQVLTSRTDLSGRFQFTGMPPGDYLVSAFTEVPEGYERSLEVMNAAQRISTRISLPRKTRMTTTLEVREYR